MANLGDSLVRLAVDPARLSRKTGIAEVRVHALIAGAEPSATELRQVASYLKLPADALFRINQITNGSDVRFRSGSVHRNPSAAEARVRELGRFLKKRNLFPRAGQALRVTATLDNRATIEDAAFQVRQILCDNQSLSDPICDLPDRLDIAGIASCVSLGDLTVEGASTIVDGRGLIVVASRTFLPRMLFTCAHELAHLVLGHLVNDRWLIDEDTVETFNSDRGDEHLCDVLASAILLPAQGVARFLKFLRTEYGGRQDVISDIEIMLLSRFFGTSFIATAMRLELLDLLPSGSGFALEEAIKRQHSSVEAYAQSLGLPERAAISMPMISAVLRSSIRAALENGNISIGRTAETFGFSHVEIADALA